MAHVRPQKLRERLDLLPSLLMDSNGGKPQHVHAFEIHGMLLEPMKTLRPELIVYMWRTEVL